MASAEEDFLSPRALRELENRERVGYFDRFIDTVLANTIQFDPGGSDKPAFEAAISAYKETLEYQGIPLSPEA